MSVEGLLPVQYGAATRSAPAASTGTGMASTAPCSAMARGIVVFALLELPEFCHALTFPEDSKYVHDTYFGIWGPTAYE